MKLISVLLTMILFFCFQENSHPFTYHLNETETTAIPLGDINNDRIADTAFVKGSKWLNEDDGFGDPAFYNVDIRFSCSLPPIENKDAVSAVVENIGDIDQDGFSEIIVVPGWWIGCWGRLHFYTMKNGNWKHAGFAERNVCEEDSYRQYITKINNQKIKVIEQAWDDKEADRIEKPKIIRIE